ncbi:hypothetical protein ACJIZ3_006282 [Penstemon smallii]|uniref:Uncharacterized protein n=1 Tax=Penstemon smallii TaxID=265156 RepID=A0ABD3S7D5_9LAMI
MSFNNSPKSENLIKLAQRLRRYKPNQSFTFPVDSAGEWGPQEEDATNPNRAAVLICLFEGENDGDLRVILTKRSSTMSSHSEVVTILEPFQTKRDITVIPVIGILWDKNAFNPIPNADEVESIFDAPLEMFLKDENRREEEREWMGYKYLLHFFDHQVYNKCYVIWALTAAILIKAASVVYQRAPFFEERRPIFWNRSRQ